MPQSIKWGFHLNCLRRDFHSVEQAPVHLNKKLNFTEIMSICALLIGVTQAMIRVLKTVVQIINSGYWASNFINMNCLRSWRFIFYLFHIRVNLHYPPFSFNRHFSASLELFPNSIFCQFSKTDSFWETSTETVPFRLQMKGLNERALASLLIILDT